MQLAKEKAIYKEKSHKPAHIQNFWFK